MHTQPHGDRDAGVLSRAEDAASPQLGKPGSAVSTDPNHSGRMRFEVLSLKHCPQGLTEATVLCHFSPAVAVLLGPRPTVFSEPHHVPVSSFPVAGTLGRRKSTPRNDAAAVTDWGPLETGVEKGAWRHGSARRPPRSPGRKLVGSSGPNRLCHPRG